MLLFMRRWHLVGSALAGVLALSGCTLGAGGNTPAPGPRTHPASQSAVTPGALLAQIPHPSLYTPTGVVSPPSGSNPLTFAAPLIPGTGQDTVTVTVSGQGQGQLTVTGPTGSPLWRLPHVDWAGALKFSGHAPVLLTEADADYCGTGGCLYTAYTWNPRTKRLGTIPFQPWNAVSYRYQAATRTWTVQVNRADVGGLGAASFLGWAGLSSVGLSTDTRTYDADNGQVAEVFRYAAVAGSATGEWVPAGSPRFSPTTPYPGYLDVVSPASALALYLTAATENLPAMAAPLVVPPAAAPQLWRIAKPLGALGLGADVNPAPLADPGHSQGLGETVSGVLGSGPDARLVADVADATVTTVGGLARITGLSLGAVPLKVASVAAVLTDLQAHPRLIQWFAAHPNATVSLAADGTDWELTYSNGATGSVNAVTGAIQGAP